MVRQVDLCAALFVGGTVLALTSGAAPAQRSTDAGSSVAVADKATAPQSTATPTVPISRPLAQARPRVRQPVPASGVQPGETVPVTTLAEALSLTYRTNPQLLAQRATVRSTDYRYPGARSQYGPSVSVTGGYGYTYTREEIAPGQNASARGWASNASGTINQPLTTFGRTSAAVATAFAEANNARDTLQTVENQILLDAVVAYVDVVRDAAAVTIARQNLELLQRQYGDDRERFRVREITSTDLEQVETRVEFGQAQLTSALGQLGTSQSGFLRTIGARAGELAPPDLINAIPATLAEAYTTAEANSPGLRAAQSRERISRAQVEAARAEWRPRVDLQGSVTYDSVTPYSDSLRRTDLVGRAVVTQPLFDSGLRTARIREAREANEADWRLVDEALREVHQDVGNAWDRLAAARASIVHYRAAAAAAQRAYDGALLQQKTGDRTTLDVLDLARDLLNIRLSYNASLADEYVARASLLASLGRLERLLLMQGLIPDGTPGHFDEVKHQGDIPLLTPILAGLDGAANRDTRRDRPVRDPGALDTADAPLPLDPEAPELFGTTPTP